MDNVKALGRAGFRRADQSAWIFNKARSKAFDLEIVREAPTDIIIKCLEEPVADTEFRFYYWGNPPHLGACGKLLAQLTTDRRIRPVPVNVYGSPVYHKGT